MIIPNKRYYTLVETALIIDRSYPMTKSLIRAFNITSRGKPLLVDARDVDYLRNCAKLMTKCRKLDWVGSLPKYLIKDLINKL